MDENISLKVRRGAQIFGPMSLIQLAELLAAGRVAEADEVSADGQTWQPMAEFFERQSAAPGGSDLEEPPGPRDDEDFLLSFDDVTPAEPPSTLFDEDDVEQSSPSPGIPTRHQPEAPARRSSKPPATLRARALLDDDELDEQDEGSADLDNVLRQLLEHERTAPALNEPRRQPAARTNAPPMKMTAQERRDGFVMMFNGRNFSGWRFGEASALPDRLPDNWKVERGLIRLTGGGKPSCMTQWDYGDFDFRFAWRAIAGQYNGGLCLRSGRRIGVNQISLRQGEEGTFPGGQIEGAENAAKLQNPPGEWNEWRVLATGDTLKLWCNDQLAWQANGLEPAAGYLGFLAAGAAFEFANLRIKEIDCEYLNNLQLHWSPAAGWKQMGDSIVGEKGKSVPLETAGRDYADYVLRFDWKLTRGAGGTLYLRGADCDKAAIALGGVGGGSGCFPSLGITPDEQLDNPGVQWNFMEVQVVNNAASVRLNGGEAVRKVRLPRGAVPARGPIGLSHNGRPIQVRNIRIKSLKNL